MPPWIKLTADRVGHRKLRKAGVTAVGLEDLVMCQVAKDGGARIVRGLVGRLGKPGRAGDVFVDRETVIGVGVQHGLSERQTLKIAELLASDAVGRWELDRDGWWILGYLEHNHTAEEWEALVDGKARAGRESGASRRGTPVERALNGRSDRRSTSAGTDAEPSSSSSSVEDLRSSSSEDEDFEAALEIIVADEARAQTSRGNPPKTAAWRRTVLAERRERYAPLLPGRPPGTDAEQLADYLRNPDGYQAAACDDQHRRDVTAARLRAEIRELEDDNANGAFSGDIAKLTSELDDLMADAS